MTRRCVPLRGDHNLLNPDARSLSGVKLQEDVWSGGVVSPSGHVGDLSNKRYLEVSLTQRLRFEDETEMEAESRYLERQRQKRQVEPRRETGVLASNRDLNLRTGVLESNRDLNLRTGVLESNRDLNLRTGVLASKQDLNLRTGVLESNRDLNLRTGVLASNRDLNLRTGVLASKQDLNLRTGVLASNRDLNLRTGVLASNRDLNLRTGVLASKPNLNLYVNNQPGLNKKRVEPIVDWQQRGHMVVQRIDHSDPCGIIFGEGLNLALNLHRPVAEGGGRRTHQQLWTEPIRETYIGGTTPAETRSSRSNNGGERGGADHKQVTWRETQVSTPQDLSTIDLPINPYASYTKTPSFQPFDSVTWMSQSERLNGTKARKNPTQNQKEQERLEANQVHIGLTSGSGLRGKNSSLSSGRAPVASGSSDGLIRPPTSTKSNTDCASNPERLNRTRTSSLDRLTSETHASIPDHSTSGSRKSCGLLKKSRSLQSLRAGVPSSVPSFGSKQKKNCCSDDYQAADEQ